MKIFKESKQKGVLGILQVKELLMSIISQIYRYSISDSSLLLFHNLTLVVTRMSVRTALNKS